MSAGRRPRRSESTPSVSAPISGAGGAGVSGQDEKTSGLAAGLAVSFTAIGLFVATIGYSIGLDGEVFRQAGAVLLMPEQMSVDYWLYRDYVQGSKGEFTVAKDQYVRLHTGWFSDRSACYLAAGRPVITPETGLIKAEGIVLSCGRRVGTAEGRITDADGRLLAHGTTTCLIFQH